MVELYHRKKRYRPVYWDFRGVHMQRAWSPPITTGTLIALLYSIYGLLYMSDHSWLGTSTLLALDRCTKQQHLPFAECNQYNHIHR